MKAPLEGIRILDLTRVLSGPYCTMLLGDLGARVIKVERPGHGDENRSVIRYPGRAHHDDYFYPMNRSKESIAIDLKVPAGRDLARRLASQCHVVVENFAPGVADRLGLGYEELAAGKPDLIYCSISGFGHESPHRDRKAYDPVIQAVGGLMSVTGEAGGLLSGLLLGDLSASLYAGLAILGAIYRVRATGEGQKIDISMADCLVSLWGLDAAAYLGGGPVPRPPGHASPDGAPGRTFLTSDGRRLWVEATDSTWPALARLIGHGEWLEDPRFATAAGRWVHRAELEGAVAAWVAGRCAADCIAELQRVGVPHAPVYDLAEAMQDPHTLARDLLFEMEHPLGAIRQIRSPYRFAGEPVPIHCPPPLLGQHTWEILHEVTGLSPDEIAALMDEGVIATAARNTRSELGKR